MNSLFVTHEALSIHDAKGNCICCRVSNVTSWWFRPQQVYGAALQSQLGGRLSQMGWNVSLRVTVVAAPIPAGYGKVGVRRTMIRTVGKPRTCYVPS
jgi:hypothetical protein